LRTVEVEKLIDEGHSARSLWELVGRLDLALYHAQIAAVEGHAGREHTAPQFDGSDGDWRQSVMGASQESVCAAGVGGVDCDNGNVLADPQIGLAQALFFGLALFRSGGRCCVCTLLAFRSPEAIGKTSAVDVPMVTRLCLWPAVASASLVLVWAGNISTQAGRLEIFMRRFISKREKHPIPSRLLGAGE
jgi:hypothetical protein